MIAYLDTSAILKLLHQEPGSEEAAAIWFAASRVAASLLAYPEARAALAAGRRSGRISPRIHAAARRSLEGLWQRIAVIEVSEALARDAAALAEQHRLRAGDAVHLASALAIGGRQTVLATWDRDLSRAAREAGMLVTP